MTKKLELIERLYKAKESESDARAIYVEVLKAMEDYPDALPRHRRVIKMIMRDESTHDVALQEVLDQLMTEQKPNKSDDIITEARGGK